MPDAPPTCPDCEQTLKAGGFVLSGREDDGARACRMLWRCSDRHFWWKMADRPDDPLELCPHPQLFRS
ncbi:dehydrogenase [Streptomyces sp. NPDC058572]|uniref:dehydrogenase n=1 Tax=Streptomyces sp. NPDC058572 TaxID=3346546 RepID=UPI00365F767A